MPAASVLAQINISRFMHPPIFCTCFLQHSRSQRSTWADPSCHHPELLHPGIFIFFLSHLHVCINVREEEVFILDDALLVSSLDTDLLMTFTLAPWCIFYSFVSVSFLCFCISLGWSEEAACRSPTHFLCFNLQNLQHRFWVHSSPSQNREQVVKLHAMSRSRHGSSADRHAVHRHKVNN